MSHGSSFDHGDFVMYGEYGDRFGSKVHELLGTMLLVEHNLNLSLGLVDTKWCLFVFPAIYISYESQPVGLAEVIDASKASLGGPGGRAGKMSVN